MTSLDLFWIVLEGEEFKSRNNVSELHFLDHFGEGGGLSVCVCVCGGGGGGLDGSL